ncbi:MAG: NUDIX domain-containing protein [Lentisphaeria bacterium]
MSDNNAIIRPYRLRNTTIAAGDWLRLEEVTFVDEDGRYRTWETATRQNTEGAVYMVTTLQPSGRFVLIRQYRPSPDSEVVEFPAGLIDPEEDAAVTAIRELKEETGYTGELKRITPPSLSSPGMTGEQVYIAFVEVDEKAPENQCPAQDCDDGENIEVYIKKPEEIHAFLEECTAAGVQLDSRLVAFFLGQGIY